jgi:hypothetical protein
MITPEEEEAAVSEIENLLTEYPDYGKGAGAPSGRSYAKMASKPKPSGERLTEPRTGFKLRDVARWIAAVLVAGGLLCGQEVLAAEPDPATAKPGPFSFRSEAWTLYVSAKGAPASAPVFGTRLQGTYTQGRVTLAARFDSAMQKDKVSADAAGEPEMYTTAEFYGLAAFEIFEPVSIAAVAGQTYPTIGEDGPARSTWLAGLLVGTRDRWVLAGVSEHRAVGQGLRPAASWQVKIRYAASLVGDVVVKLEGGRVADYQVRSGVSVDVPIDVSLFGGKP